MYRHRSYRRHRLRARQTVVWFLAAALSSQFAIALALEISAPKIRDPEYGRKLTHLQEQIAADPQRPRILAIGSSRTLNGLRPERLSSAKFAVFNFGLTAARPGPPDGCLRPTVARRCSPDGRDARSDAGNVALGPDRNGFGPGCHIYLARRRISLRAEFALFRIRTRLARPARPIYASRFPLLNHVFPAWMSANTRQDHIWGLTTADGWLEARMKGSMQPTAMRHDRRNGAQLGPAIPCLGRRPASVSRYARPLPRGAHRSRTCPHAGSILVRAITPPGGESLLRLVPRQFVPRFRRFRNRCSGLVPGRGVFFGWPSSARSRADRFTDRYGRDVLPHLASSRP